MNNKSFGSMWRKTAVLMLLLILAGSVFPVAAVQQSIRVESALVTVPVIVNDPKGRFVSGLNVKQFSLYQDGAPTDISLFLTSEDPIKVALLLDTSQSTTSVLEKIKKAAGRFLLQMRPKDVATIVSFDADIQVLCPLSSDPGELRDGIRKARASGGNTRVRDAIADIVQKRFRSVSGRKAIVLLTDGEDVGSRIPEQALFKDVAAGNTMIYSVYYRVDPREIIKKLTGVSTRIPKESASGTDALTESAARRQKEAAGFLESLAELSAGKVFRSDIGGLDQAFQQVSDELRSQYLLGFYPEESKLDGELHSIDVKVSLPGALIRSRRNYRATR